MATIELEPIIGQQEDEAPDDSDDHQECHLYLSRTKAMCGLPVARDTHAFVHPTEKWQKGQLACPVCGIPICVDCLLAANAR